ncbi:MAG TPA: MFS transporter [Chloroflexota bacterium]|nr:MFS transporter [Chloroflexota bacterium]
MLPPPLRNRDFRRFYTGSMLSTFGTQFTTVAMAWQMYELTNSPLQVGLIGLTRAVPQIALAVFGGMLADVLDRRRLLISVQLISFVVSASLAALTFMGRMSPQLLLSASVLFALTSALETPSRQAVVPNIVPREDLSSAMALFNTQRGVAMIAGPSLAGVTLGFTGPAVCYCIDAISWFAMVTGVALIRKPLQVSSAKPSLEAILAGARFVVSQQVILSFMILDFGATFFGSVNALLPIYARDILAVGPVGLGVLYAAISVGAVVTGIAMSLFRIERAGKWVLIGVAIYGVCTMGFAASHLLWLSVLMLAGTGAGNAVSAVLRQTSNQMLTPDNLRGRVSAFNSIFTQGGPQLGQFESGLVADLGGAPLSGVTGGLGCCLLVAGIALLPRVRSFSLTHEKRAAAIA